MTFGGAALLLLFVGLSAFCFWRRTAFWRWERSISQASFNVAFQTNWICRMPGR